MCGLVTGLLRFASLTRKGKVKAMAYFILISITIILGFVLLHDCWVLLRMKHTFRRIKCFMDPLWDNIQQTVMQFVEDETALLKALDHGDAVPEIFPSVLWAETAGITLVLNNAIRRWEAYVKPDWENISSREDISFLVKQACYDLNRIKDCLRDYNEFCSQYKKTLLSSKTWILPTPNSWYDCPERFYGIVLEVY